MRYFWKIFGLLLKNFRKSSRKFACWRRCSISTYEDSASVQNLDHVADRASVYRPSVLYFDNIREHRMRKWVSVDRKTCWIDDSIIVSKFVKSSSGFFGGQNEKNVIKKKFWFRKRMLAIDKKKNFKKIRYSNLKIKFSSNSYHTIASEEPEKFFEKWPNPEHVMS